MRLVHSRLAPFSSTTHKLELSRCSDNSPSAFTQHAGFWGWLSQLPPAVIHAHLAALSTQYAGGVAVSKDPARDPLLRQCAALGSLTTVPQLHDAMAALALDARSTLGVTLHLALTDPLPEAPVPVRPHRLCHPSHTHSRSAARGICGFAVR
jgi:hypothetical protein